MAKNKKNNTKAKNNKNNKLVTPVVNNSSKEVADVVVSDKANVEEQVVPTIKDASVVDGKKKNKVVEVKAKDVGKKNNKNDKKPNKIVKSLKDTGNELKKVTWPKFKDVVKQTGIVLVVVIVFAIVLFGIDQLCALLTGLLF